MAIKNTALGGVDFGSGGSVYAADLNDTFNQSIMHIDKWSILGGSEIITPVGSPFVTIGSKFFTPSFSSGNVLIGVGLNTNIKGSAGESARAYVEISQNNNGTWYSSNEYSPSIISTNGSSYVSDNGFWAFGGDMVTTGQNTGVGATGSYLIKVLVAADGAGSVYLSGATLSVYSLDGAKIYENSTKFA